MLIRGLVPLCMSQYERVFSTTRVPGEVQDVLVTYSRQESRHIAVLSRGVFYKLDMYQQNGTPYTQADLEEAFDEILRDSSARSMEGDLASKIPAFTADNRTTWWQLRNKHFASGLNKASLNAIESAMFVVVLDEASPNSPTEQGRLSLHGTGYNRWCDKSFNCIIYANGKASLHAEHSYADAPVTGHMWEWACSGEFGKDTYNAQGRSTDQTRTGKPSYSRLSWDVSPELGDAIKQSVARAEALVQDLDLCIVNHEAFGKGAMKKAKISPDAFVQMAMQIAYYRDQGNKFCLTYEACMTRLYRDGRTETVRTCSEDSAAFVKALDDPAVPKEEKIRMLHTFGRSHQDRYRGAMSGKGLDRHLFGMYVVSKGLSIPSEFLQQAISIPWRLSTSQIPQQQTDRWNPNDPKDQLKVSPGGGFGPVADDGYGVSYMLAGENRVFFHVSSKRSATNTDSTRFGQRLVQAMEDMRALCA
eukprot:Colp12_sorted_trinity150504_noHs@14456